VDPGKKILIFPMKFPKNFDFSRQVSEKFRFLQANFRKISIFPRKFLKYFGCLQAKIAEWSFF